MTNSHKTIILAAGGTGGHVFPAKALAERLTADGHEVVLITDRRSTGFDVAMKNLTIKTIDSASPSGGLIKKLKGFVSLGLGYLQARKLLKKIKPNKVIGFGGYPSFPTMLAATHLRLPTIIHEQNAVLGKVNRFLASSVSTIATSFDNTLYIKKQDEAKTICTGNPVRSAIAAIHELPYPEYKENEHLHLLVTGGSQGAKIFSNLISDAVLALPEDKLKRIRIDQQCKEEDISKLKEKYEKAGVDADLASFFDDIPARLASAHIVVARSGASTIAELAASGRPSLLIPYMYATDDHQTANAKVLADKEAAIILPQKDITAEIITDHLSHCIDNADSLKLMAERAKAAGKIKAVEELMAIALH